MDDRYQINYVPFSYAKSCQVSGRLSYVVGVVANRKCGEQKNKVINLVPCNTGNIIVLQQPEKEIV